MVDISSIRVNLVHIERNYFLNIQRRIKIVHVHIGTKVFSKSVVFLDIRQQKQNIFKNVSLHYKLIGPFSKANNFEIKLIAHF